MLQPYVSRPEVEAFLVALGHAFEEPQSNPVVFHVWGIGGVGKSTLTRRAQETYQGKANFAAVSFGLTEGIDEPIPLMATLYGQLVAKDAWNRDPFWDKYSLYRETILKLQTEPANGRGDATPEQVGQVKQLLQLGVDVAGELFLPESAKKTAITLLDRGVDAVAAGLSLKDGVQQLLQQHKATRRNVELQEFMLAPLPKLTQAFVEGLSQQGKQQPIILVLDTYEKAPTTIDTWLWRTLLGNTNVATQPVRLVIAGRNNLLKTEGWRKLQQDRHAIRDLTIERFDLPQTQDYLAQIDLTDAVQIERIFQVTRGLPYYLNWIREETQKGHALNFDQGNQEIVRLLLQGLNDTQKFLIQLAACCRWFDAKIIRYLTEKESLDFASAVDEERNCYGWLTQLAFAEPVGKYWRLDDVARSVFRHSLERDDLSQIHGHLADYFLTQSNQEVDPNGPPSDQYENPDWLELRAEYLYHLLFAEPVASQQPFLTHLLEASYFRKDAVIQLPFLAIASEFDVSQHPLLRHRQRQFLAKVYPAVLYSRAVLEEIPVDYLWLDLSGFSQAAIDQSIDLCLGYPKQFTGLAQVLALYYCSCRCESNQAISYLLQAYEQAQLLSPTQTTSYLADLYLWKLGNALANLGQHEASLAAYNTALKIIPDKYEALNNKGNSLFNLGKYKAAIAAYDAALTIKPDNHEIVNNRGNVLYTLGEYDAAIASYDMAIDLKPDNHEALYNRAVALLKLGHYKASITAYNTVLDINPDNHNALNNKGNALFNLGDYEAAAIAYGAALTIKPNDQEILYNRAVTLLKLGQYEAAITAYDTVLVINPSNHEALNNKGVALAYLGQKEAALDAFNAALILKPNFYGAIYSKACCYGLQGDAENAIDYLQKAIDLDPQYRAMAKTDTDFDPIRHDERFRALVEGE